MYIWSKITSNSLFEIEDTDHPEVLLHALFNKISFQTMLLKEQSKRSHEQGSPFLYTLKKN